MGRKKWPFKGRKTFKVSPKCTYLSHDDDELYLRINVFSMTMLIVVT